MRRQVVEPELHVEVREAVVVCDAVLVDAVLLLADGHHRQCHAHLLLHHQVQRVRCADAVEREGAVRGGPRRNGAKVQIFTVVRHLQLVDSLVPLGNGLGSDGELVAAEHKPERLHPREVAGAAFGALADEVRVDVEVGVGDEAEVLVLVTVEVEDDAVTADDLGVATHAPLLFTVGCTSPHIAPTFQSIQHAMIITCQSLTICKETNNLLPVI